MGTLRIDAEAVLAVAEQVLANADRLDEIRWPTLSSADMPGSAVELAAASSTPTEDRLADVIGHLRAWAAAARAATGAIQQAEAQTADRLGAPR